MTFTSPWFLGLFLPTLVIFWFLAKGRLGREPSLLFSYLPLLKEVEVKHRKYSSWRHWHLLKRFVPVILFILALARPQTMEVEAQPVGRATEFVFIVDTSVGMQSRAFGRQSCLKEVEEAIASFVKGRPYDSFGLVAFSGSPMLLCPTTSDQTFFLKRLEQLDSGPGGDGRWYGAAIASGLSHLTAFKERRSVAVLISDGNDVSSPELRTEDAWKVAREMGVPIYSVGMGVKAEDIIPHEEPRYKPGSGVMDERTLFQVARRTGGIYYRAPDVQALGRVMHEIHSLEDYQITTTTVRHPRDHFFWLAATGLAWLVGATLLDRVWFQRLP